MTGWLLVQRGVLAQASLDLRQAIAGAAGAVALVAAAIWLERCCKVPSPPGGDLTDGDRRPGAGAGDDPDSRGR
jgi:hypothetical protein